MRRLVLPLTLSLVLPACFHDPNDTAPKDGTIDSADADTDTDSDADTDSDTDTDTEPVGPVSYALDVVKQGTMADLNTAGMARMSSTNNNTYVLDSPVDGSASPLMHYLMDSYTNPIPNDYCVEGEIDEATGACRGVLWTSGRLYNPISPKPTTSFCIDEPNGRMFLIKDQGTRVEIADIVLEGDDPYSYNFPYAKIDLQADVTANNTEKYLGPCEYLAASDELLMTSRAAAEAPGMVIIGASEGGTLHRGADLGVNPTHAYGLADGETVIVDDPASRRLVRLDTTSLTESASWSLDSTLVHFGVNRLTGLAYLAHGSAGAFTLDTTNGSATEVSVPGVEGTVEWAFADQSHGLGWFVSDTGGGQYTVYMVQDGEVVTTSPVPDTVVSVAEPGDMGDLVVFQKGTSASSGSYTVYGARPLSRDGRPPLKIFLFTTIEEPSDTNFDEPCEGNGTTFENELNLVQSNASRLAALGVPVAMAITDNFAEKAEQCEQQAIYEYLDGLGFELGAMLHNRPCYNCSTGDSVVNDAGQTSNPEYCNADDANFIAPSSSAACFPDDPEYCDEGDWDCYYAFLAPRVDIADRNIPGGAKFIVGGDRHGMWEYDWLRLYQEVDRPSTGQTGFDVTLFAGTWAYNNIAFDDPRGKNPTPWRPQERVAAWKPGDIDNWRGESAYSSILYLSGINSATVKIGEQQSSGMYMEDFFDFISDFTVKYDDSDYEVQWENLRQAVNYRQADRVNTWYFHIHDNGIVNLGDASGNDVTVTDSEGNEIAADVPLQEFVQRINDTYVAAGVVEWAYPSDIKGDYVAW